MLQKRLFFGMEIAAPWPGKLPPGRILEKDCRHLTLAFLGNIDYAPLEQQLPNLPLPPFKVGLAGKFDQCLFLPKRHPHVVAWGGHWYDDPSPIASYQKELVHWLQEHGFAHSEPEREWLPHVTISRQPKNLKEWQSHFAELPFITSSIHLYESVGNLRYAPLWSHPLKPPFKEIEHTADIAFLIHGETLEQIHKHAQIALAFRFPKLLRYFPASQDLSSLDIIIRELNNLIQVADSDEGSPFKAVCYHGDLVKEEDGTFTWEMIVDV